MPVNNLPKIRSDMDSFCPCGCAMMPDVMKEKVLNQGDSTGTHKKDGCGWAGATLARRRPLALHTFGWAIFPGKNACSGKRWGSGALGSQGSQALKGSLSGG